ncbi:MAG: BrnT family toxin [Acidobacteriota bacterium]|nr:BrnT family toxin [Acidobacteriota bacterium]
MLLDPSTWEGFDWDDGNIGKNWSHRVTDWEAEEVFFNVPIIYAPDEVHSATEQRFFALGQSNRGRWLFVSFTVRHRLVRIISTRDMNARERRVYDSTKEDSNIH